MARHGIIHTREIDGQTLCCTEDVGDYLGVQLKTTDITDTLGVPFDHKARRARYWSPDKLPVIRAKLIKFLQEHGNAA